MAEPRDIRVITVPGSAFHQSSINRGSYCKNTLSRAIMQLFTLLLILLVPIHPSYWLYKRLAYFGAFRSAFPSISTQFPSTDYFAIPEIIQAEDIAYHQPSGDLIFLGQDEGKKRYGWFPPLANFARPEDGHTSRAKLWAVDPQVSPLNIFDRMCVSSG